MEQTFRSPPASVHDTFVACLARFGLAPDDLPRAERERIMEVVRFAYTAAMGRLCAQLPPPDKCRRSTDKVALQMLEEVGRALQEVAHAGSTPAGKRRLNG